MERLELALATLLVGLIALGVGLRYHRESQPPIQPVVIHDEVELLPSSLEPQPVGEADVQSASPVPRPATAETPHAATLSQMPVVPVVRQQPQVRMIDPALQRLNQCDKPRLQQVKGIGEVYAERIIRTRDQRGGFRSWEELLEVRGIGEKRLEDLKESFRIGP